MGSILLRLWDWFWKQVEKHRGHWAAMGTGFAIGCLVCVLLACAFLRFLPHGDLAKLVAVVKGVEPIPCRGQEATIAPQTPPPGSAPQTRLGSDRQPQVESRSAQVGTSAAAAVARALREMRDRESDDDLARALDSCLLAYRLLPSSVRQRVDASSSIRLAAIDVDGLRDMKHLSGALSQCKAQLGTRAVTDFLKGESQ